MVALGRVELWISVNGLYDKPLATKNCSSARQLPGIGDQQNWGIGMVVAQPIRGKDGVLPGGAGTGITGDPGRRNALALKGLSGADASSLTCTAGAPPRPELWRRRPPEARDQAAP